MWHLIGRSVGTHLFLCFCLLDCWLHIESSWYHYPWCMLGCCVHLRHRYVDYIDWSFQLFLTYWHSPCCMITLLTLTCTFFLLLSRSSWHIWFLVVYYHDCYWARYHCQIFFSISLWVDLDDIYLFCMTVCCMITLILRDCMSFVRVGHTTIPLPPTLLVSIIPFIPVLTFASVKPCVFVTLIEPEVRRRV